MMNERTNVGYTIINAVTVGKGEIVLGERTTANKEKQYVTWECNNGSYYYGHYTENKFDALKDFGQRVVDKSEFYRDFEKVKQKNNREREER